MPETKMAGSLLPPISRLRRWFAYCKLCFLSLFYSANPGDDWLLEFMFQPVYHLVELVVPWAGPVRLRAAERSLAPRTHPLDPGTLTFILFIVIMYLRNRR